MCSNQNCPSQILFNFNNEYFYDLENPEFFMHPRKFPVPNYPFADQVSPLADLMVKNVHHWIDTSYQLFSIPAREKYRQMNIGTLAALCFPRVSSQANMQPL